MSTELVVITSPITSPTVKAAKALVTAWTAGISHGNALREWLKSGEHKDLAACRYAIARGDRCTNHFGDSIAALLFSKHRWIESKTEQTRQLMMDYVAAGLIKVESPLTLSEGDPSFAYNRLMPLELAMVCTNAETTCVLLESGAMDVTKFDAVLTDFGTGEPRPGEAFDAFARSQFASAPESLARFTEIILRRQLEGLTAPVAASESVEVAATAPLRRKRVL
ncbi:hypothetical protein [Paucibacter soli]|uniref:hypothetical protein n=1 Tax=Paucibacter soli TaxID=3133433 RepID=UPI0030A047C4